MEMEMLQLPFSLSRLLAIVVGLVVVLFVVGSFSWPIAILVVCFSALALPFMLVIMKGEH
jgi:hypothetical protein